MATMLLRVPELHDGDAEKLEAVLRALPGVFAVVVSPGEGCVEIDFEDDEVGLDRILDRVREAGYEASLSG